MPIELVNQDDIKTRNSVSDNYYEGRICCVCDSSDTGKNNSGNPQWYDCNCNKENCTRHLCTKCYAKVYKRLPDSVLNRNVKWRRGLLFIEDNNAKGIIGEAVVAKVRNLEILSIKTDNFNYKFDLSYDRQYGIFQVKFRILLDKWNKWNIRTEISQNYDSLIALCVYKENIDRVYIVPKKELHGLTDLAIYKNPSRGVQWYENFLVDEKPYNDAYHNLMEFLKDKKYFGIEDIKKWLEIEN